MPSDLASDRASDLVSIWAGRHNGTVLREDAADEPHYAASLVKLPLAIAAQRLDLDRRVPVHADFDSAVPDRRFALAEADDQDPATWSEMGGQLTLRELVRRSLVVSGNLAADLVLEHVGIGAVQGILPTVTRGIGDAPAADAGLVNLVTARELGRVLLATPPSVEEVLRGQTYRDAIPAGLPSGTRVANKTGWVDGVTHDAAIVRPVDAPAFALVVLTRLDVPTDEANAVIARIAAEVWETATVGG